MLLGAADAVRSRPKDEEVLKDEQIKRFKNDLLREVFRPSPLARGTSDEGDRSDREVSERRVCRLLQLCRATVQRRPTDAPRAGVGPALQELIEGASPVRLSTPVGLAPPAVGNTRPRTGSHGSSGAAAPTGSAAISSPGTTSGVRIRRGAISARIRFANKQPRWPDFRGTL